MKLNFACKSCGLTRVARVEPCHWSEGYVGVSLQEMRATMQVMLGVSLQANMGRNSSQVNRSNILLNYMRDRRTNIMHVSFVYLRTFVCVRVCA